jgi:hypothetical protein
MPVATDVAGTQQLDLRALLSHLFSINFAKVPARLMEIKAFA